MDTIDDEHSIVYFLMQKSWIRVALEKKRVAMNAQYKKHINEMTQWTMIAA